MQIVLYMLKAWLGASRTHLSRHLLDKPLIGPMTNQAPGNLAAVASDSEREELKTALIATQESAVVQIVLEICLEIEDDQVCLILETSDKKNCLIVGHIALCRRTSKNCRNFAKYRVLCARFFTKSSLLTQIWSSWFIFR